VEILLKFSHVQQQVQIMARTKATLSGTARLADYLTVGYLALQCPVREVRQTLERHGLQSQRQCAIPRDVLIYYVMMMVLYGNVAYEEVFQYVIEGLRRALGDETLAKRSVTKGAISQARSFVGEAPFKDLYESQVTPHGPADMAGVMFHGHRIMALDGSTMDMPDEAANAKAFGYAQSQRGTSAFPLLRFVALVECGTHTLCHAKHGAFCEGEVTLAQAVLPKADASMVITADRLFYGYELWQMGLNTGAKLVWRVKKSLDLPREGELPDGSYLSHVYPDARSKRKKEKTLVRVVEYKLRKAKAGESPKEGEEDSSYRLITNWTGEDAPTALELAELYHQRWAIEESLDELKTHLAARAIVLRSKRPELVKQEFYALLLAHAAIRRLMTQAAAQGGRSSTELSFTHAVQVLKRRLPSASAIPP
jgi:hypothetical protein